MSLDEWEERNVVAVLKMQVLQGDLDQLNERYRRLAVETHVQTMEIEKLRDYAALLERKISEIQTGCRHERASSTYDARNNRELFNCPMCLLHEEVDRGSYDGVRVSSTVYRRLT